MFASLKISRASMLHLLLTPDVPARASGRQIFRSDTITACQRNDPPRRIYFGLTHCFEAAVNRSAHGGALGLAARRKSGACKRQRAAKLTSQDFGWI
jgi:hypothetical protein